MSRQREFGEQLLVSVEEFDLPKQPFFDLIDGMEMDLKWHSYQTFADLREYCYRAASAVGLICIEIFGYESARTREYAVNLGLALQLTNILRDLKEDIREGGSIFRSRTLNASAIRKRFRENRYNAPFIEFIVADRVSITAAIAAAKASSRLVIVPLFRGRVGRAGLQSREGADIRRTR